MGPSVFVERSRPQTFLSRLGSSGISSNAISRDRLFIISLSYAFFAVSIRHGWLQSWPLAIQNSTAERKKLSQIIYGDAKIIIMTGRVWWALLFVVRRARKASGGEFAEQWVTKDWRRGQKNGIERCECVACWVPTENYGEIGGKIDGRLCGYFGENLVVAHYNRKCHVYYNWWSEVVFGVIELALIFFLWDMTRVVVFIESMLSEWHTTWKYNFQNRCL